MKLLVEASAKEEVSNVETIIPVIFNLDTEEYWEMVRIILEEGVNLVETKNLLLDPSFGIENLKIWEITAEQALALSLRWRLWTEVSENKTLEDRDFYITVKNLEQIWWTA